jgi:hypothetical protein
MSLLNQHLTLSIRCSVSARLSRADIHQGVAHLRFVPSSEVGTFDRILSWLGSRDADAHIDHSIGIARPYPRGGPKRFRTSAKCAAAQHMHVTISCRPRRSVRWRIDVAVSSAILYPVVDVAVDLKEPPRVGGKRIHRNCFGKHRLRMIGRIGTVGLKGCEIITPPIC